MDQLNKSIRNILKNCLNIQPNEYLTILIQDSLSEIENILWSTAKKITEKVILVKYATPAANLNENTPLSKITSLLANTDVCIILSSVYSEENSFSQALKKGTRILLIQNASISMIKRTLVADLDKVTTSSRKLADLFTIGRRLTLSAPSGTEITVDISKLKGIANTGIAKQPGQLASFPFGAASLPLNGNLDGKIAFDRIAGAKNKCKTPIFLNVDKGHITQIKGAIEAQEFRKNLRKLGKTGRNITKFGIGTNNFISFGNSELEDEKKHGAIHFSLGENQFTKIQGKMLNAITGIVLNPTLNIDGKLIVKDGNILV